jgi:hypothetical protein
MKLENTKQCMSEAWATAQAEEVVDPPLLYIKKMHLDEINLF